MRAYQLTAPREFTEVDLPEPKLEKGTILTKTAFVSICGSDWYTVNHGRDYDVFPLPVGRPIHEVSEIVVESDDPDFAPGDRVLDVAYDGGLKEYHLRTASQLVKLPNSPTLEELLMSQPLGVVLHACRKWPSLLGQSAVVMGQGAIGQFFTAVLKMQGAGPIITVDMEDGRLMTSQKMGATDTLNAGKVNVLEAVKDLTGGKGPDMVVEACGQEATYNMAIDMARKGGMMTFFGLPKYERTSLKLTDLIRRDGVIFTSNQGERDADFALARDLIASGKVYVRPLISHKLPVGDILTAFQLAENRADNALKIVLEY